MPKRCLPFLIIAVLLLSLLTACQKSASQNPVKTPTDIFPTPLNQNAIDLSLAGTQTSEALTAATKSFPVAETATSEIMASPPPPTLTATMASVSTDTKAVINSPAPSNTPVIQSSPLPPTFTPVVNPTITGDGIIANGGVPSFTIYSVVQNSTVTIKAENFPANIEFVVLMAPFGNLGIGGTQASRFNTGAGGNFTATFVLPDSVKGTAQIAIRIQSDTGYYYAYNWFWNATS